jgi:murein DD-endopeptidase MepM/ murein hydrolase activator NlpD
MRLSPSTDTIRAHRRRSRLRGLLLIAGAVALAAAGLGAFRAGPAPVVAVRTPFGAIGRATPVEVDVTVPSRGFSRVVVELLQGERTLPIAEESFATPPGWKLWESGTKAKSWKLTVGKDSLPALVEGEAKLRVTGWGAPAWLRAARATTMELALPVRLVPPSLGVRSTQHYVAQGGAEVVVYDVGPTSVRDGVEVGDWFFPGFPLPGGGERERFALFAVPWDVDDPAKVRLVAADEVGNARSASFVDQFFPKPPARDDIQLDDRLLARVVPEILDNTPGLTSKGNLLDDYLQINRDLRRANAEELRSLAGRSRREFLWTAPFLALPGGQVMSAFADRRTYFHQGREVDRQVHLGYDLASIARADVPAANAGVVVLARWLGIYGNTVVVDHGYGLMSLYAHLSSIAVAEGDTVGRGAVLGRSGTTGLAGGDHLHFSFLLQGLPVRPVEWWDPHWIGDRLKRKLGAALPYGG